uniref:EDAR n=1 Tax=Magallana hongkongensis TaxID=2653900 RepID=A0A1L3GTQ1_MAGHO|nr:EDAR [Crassostrea hongkongensis]
MGFPPVLVLLSVAVTAAVAADPPVYCQVDNNEFYMRQWGRCKACDRCPYGFGLNSKITFEVDPVYGALRCRDCLKCTEGETFKSKIGYEECQRCTNCTAIGKQVEVACTTKKDAVCMDIPPKQSFPADLQQNGRESAVPGIAASSEKRSEATGLNPTITMIGAVVLFLVCVPASIVLVKKRNELNCWRKNRPGSKSFDVDEEQGGLKDQDGGDSPVTMETSFDPETVPLRNLELPNDLSTPYDRQASIENDGFPPLSSTFSFNLGSGLDLTGCDVDLDAGRLSDAGQVTNSRSQEVPNDRELQCLCDSIADNNKYARLGRELGVKDNEIKRMKEEQNNDLLETSFQTLKRWREMKGKGATIGALRQAFRNVGLPDDILKDDP